jgi:predicted Zn-dependent protease
MQNVNQKKSTDIEHIKELLNQNQTLDALKYIERLGQDTPVLENARGVCLMRLGKFDEAATTLRNVVFQGQICIPSDTPVLYKINFATAMLLSNQKDAAFPILNQIDEKENPQAAKLKDAVKQWVKSLSLSERCRYHVGIYPKKPISLDFPPGEV